MGEENKPPKLVKRREHKNSSFMAGRTIGERREKLETANERAAARRKEKNKKAIRIIATIVVFLIAIIFVVFIVISFAKRTETDVQVDEVEINYQPTIEIVDEEAASSGITSRMREFVGQVEADLKEYDIKAVRAVVPSGAVRQVNIYLDGYSGYVKMVVDRGAGVSAEDTSRLLKYLSEIGVGDFEYIDVRIEGKAYWK